MNQALWDGIAACKATRYVESYSPWGGASKAVTGFMTGAEENKAFYEALASSWANDYKDAAIVVFCREGAEGTDLLMKDLDDDGTTVISNLALHGLRRRRSEPGKRYDTHRRDQSGLVQRK
ncbi:MAG: hypothetical protein IJ773_13225 [Lachnospiraceae bacterium]|nr:hypothetical protein [Lachnospiraceae bacterium]